MLDYSVVSEVKELLALGQSYQRIASTVGISKLSVAKIANGTHASYFPRKYCCAPIPCPVCGDVATDSIDLHSEEYSRYLVVRANVERLIALGLRTALSATDDGRRRITG